MSEMVLLGAGASVEAGVPGAYDMTREIANRFHNDEELQDYAPVLSFVIGGLLFQQGIRGSNPYRGVDVEELFNAVQLLEGRRTLEAAPFIGSWHPMISEFDKISPPNTRLHQLHRIIFKSVTDEVLRAFPNRPPTFTDKNIDKAIDNAIVNTIKAAQKNKKAHIPPWNRASRAIGEYVMGVTGEWLDNLKKTKPAPNHRFQKEFSTAVAQQQPQPGEGEIFQETNDLMIENLAKIVWIHNADRTDYLKPLLRILEKQGRLVMASLNYDNSVELLAHSQGLSVKTGIDEWSKTGTFDFDGEGLSLLKLHGSIDWALSEGVPTYERPMPQNVIRRVGADETQEPGFRPAVIFGQRNKLTAEGPFLDLLRAFQRSLAGVDRLTVVGYSFRDPHINEYLSQWLNQSRNHRMRVVSPSFEESEEQYAKQLRHIRVRGRIEVISATASEGLERVF